MEKHWKFLLHTKIAYDLRVCHDLDPRSFGQGQGHWQKKCKIRVRSLSFLWRSIECSYFTQILLMTNSFKKIEQLLFREIDGEIDSSNIFYNWKNTRIMIFILAGGINCELAHSTSSFICKF